MISCLFLLRKFLCANFEFCEHFQCNVENKTVKWYTWFYCNLTGVVGDGMTGTKLANRVLKWPVLWARFSLEKLTVSLNIKKFSTYYGKKKERFIAFFTTAHYWSLSWDTRQDSTSPYFTVLSPVLILPYHRSLSLPNDILQSGFPTKTLQLSQMTQVCFTPYQYNTHRIYCSNNITWRVQIMRPKWSRI